MGFHESKNAWIEDGDGSVKSFFVFVQRFSDSMESLLNSTV